MPLPTCQCNAGQPTQTQLANIYCALLDVLAGSGGFTPPLLPSLGGTGVANADTETITLNGGFPLALTLTGATGLTLPTTGTLVTLAGSEVLTNKILTDPQISSVRMFTVAIPVAVLTAGSPADLGSASVPSWCTRFRVTRVTTKVVTAAGTLAAAVIAGFTQAAGAGVPFMAGTTMSNLTAVDTWQSTNGAVTVGAASTLTADTTIFFRQTTNSANAGTVIFYVECLDMSP